MSKEKKIQLTIRDVPEHIVIWLDIEAAKARTSREQLLRDWLQAGKDEMDLKTIYNERITRDGTE